MADRDTEPNSLPTGIWNRLVRRVSGYGQSAGVAYASKVYQRIKNEAWAKPIETIGVVVVIFYTAFAGYQSCQMREANNLTHDVSE